MKKLMIAAVLVLAVACAKKDAAEGGMADSTATMTDTTTRMMDTTMTDTTRMMDTTMARDTAAKM